MAFFPRLLQFLLISTLWGPAFHGEAGTVPPKNPWLADSHWPVIHGGSDSQKVSPYAGPIAPRGEQGRQLSNSEIIFKALGPIELISLNYSQPYPDGRQAIWVGSHQHLVKLDASNLDVLSTYVMRSGLYTGAGEVNNILSVYDALVAKGDYQGLFDEVDRVAGTLLRDDQMGNAYALVTHKNERLFYFRDDQTGKRYLRFFGDAVAGDIDSAIELKHQWQIPEVDGKPFVPFVFNMTFDGWLVMLSNTGVLMSVAQDFSRYHTIDLAADKKAADPTLDSMRGYVRNGINIDANNGIYVVTRDQMIRVQWTGSGFSTKAEDGAWALPYPPGENGSGTTPVLMGFGEDEDRLVLIGDGESDDPRLMLFWRDEIPEDWHGLDGYDRRVAAVAEVTFQPGVKSRARIENSPAVMDWGIFIAPESPSQPIEDQGSVVKNFLAEAISASLPGMEAVGAAKWQWDPEKNLLEQVWLSPLKLAGSMCSPSRPSQMLYCIGRRDNQFTLEAIDWHTGAPASHWMLGVSMKFFPYNNLVVAPNGAVDLHGWLGMGLVRMLPNGASKTGTP
jgi:hypothetical protein